MLGDTVVPSVSGPARYSSLLLSPPTLLARHTIGDRFPRYNEGRISNRSWGSSPAGFPIVPLQSLRKM